MLLLKQPHGTWKVLDDRYDPYGHHFRSIEDASEYMEKNGIDGDEIDHALITMVKFEHEKAYFGILNGTFIYSE